MKTLIFALSLATLLFISACGGSSAPAPADTADAAVMQVVDALNQHNAAGPWHMLPAGYQAELTAVKNEFAAKMDEELWNSGAGVVKKLHGVLKDQKALLLASPMLQAVPMKEDLSANYDQLVVILGEVANSELATLESFRAMDLESYLKNTGSAILAASAKIDISESSQKPMGMNRMLKMSGKLQNVKAELVSEEGDYAVVRMSTEGEEPVETPFVKVEGKWVPQEMVDEFPKMISEMREGLAGMTITPEIKAQAQMAMSMVGGVLDQIAAAKTQQELQSSLMGIMMMMGGGM